LLTTLEQYRGRRNSNVMAAADLGVSTQTLINWCREYEIDIHSYRLVRS
jgi:transcriptional regulator with PAS, ATPase and Fis domain